MASPNPIRQVWDIPMATEAFEDAGEHDLKGIGRRRLLRLT